MLPALPDTPPQLFDWFTNLLLERVMLRQTYDTT
jgi:hypothetical protein